MLKNIRHGIKTNQGIKLLVGAPWLVIFRKGYGWPKGHRRRGALCSLQNI